MIVSIIVAMDEQGVIGAKNDLPWHLSDDLKHFKKITMGNPIVMGRKTHESIGRRLPGRENIVMTRDETYSAEGCTVLNSVDDVLNHCAHVDEVMITGGTELYKAFFEKANRIYLTEVHTKVNGDTFFPEFNRDEWNEISRENHSKDEKNDFDFSWVLLERR